MKKILAVLLSAILMAALAGCAGKSVRESEEVIDAAKLPAKYDLRNVDGQNYVTPVKCQRWGDCWFKGDGRFIHAYKTLEEAKERAETQISHIEGIMDEYFPKEK